MTGGEGDLEISLPLRLDGSGEIDLDEALLRDLGGGEFEKERGLLLVGGEEDGVRLRLLFSRTSLSNSFLSCSSCFLRFSMSILLSLTNLSLSSAALMRSSSLRFLSSNLSILSFSCKSRSKASPSR